MFCCVLAFNCWKKRLETQLAYVLKYIQKLFEVQCTIAVGEKDKQRKMQLSIVTQRVSKEFTLKELGITARYGFGLLLKINRH